MKLILEEILECTYGVSIISAPVEAVLWALDRFQNKELAKSELKILNNKRIKAGVIPVRVPYGHYAF